MKKQYFGMSVVAIAILASPAPLPAAQTAAPASLPYAAVHDPQFICRDSCGAHLQHAAAR